MPHERRFGVRVTVAMAGCVGQDDSDGLVHVVGGALLDDQIGEAHAATLATACAESAVAHSVDRLTCTNKHGRHEHHPGDEP